MLSRFFSRTASLALTAMLAAGMSAALAGPAAAAPAKPKKPAKCHLGLWKTTGLKASITGNAANGDTQNIVYQGMSGIKLKVQANRLVYDFTGSKRENITGVNLDGQEVEGWEQLTGVLYLPSKVTSDKKGLKGVFTSFYKKAAGPATGTGMNIKPVEGSWGTWQVKNHIKLGQFDTPVVKQAKFTCNPKKKTMRVVDVRKWAADAAGKGLVRYTETVDIKLKLVRR
jgi:hypothetical protein